MTFHIRGNGVRETRKSNSLTRKSAYPRKNPTPENGKKTRLVSFHSWGMGKVFDNDIQRNWAAQETEKAMQKMRSLC